MATQVEVCLVKVGDVVCILEDMAEVNKLQKGHGEWADDMVLVSNSIFITTFHPYNILTVVANNYTYIRL